MVILVTLAALFALFYFTHKHSGPAHLAVIAGLAVYESFGGQFSEVAQRLASGTDPTLVQNLVYVALVAVFPLLLYLRSGRGGLGGVVHFAEAAIFAAVLTSLLSPIIAQYCAFDTLAVNITDFIMAYEGPIVLVGVIAAYVDILIYHDY